LFIVIRLFPLLSAQLFSEGEKAFVALALCKATPAQCRWHNLTLNWQLHCGVKIAGNAGKFCENCTFIKLKSVSVEIATFA